MMEPVCIILVIRLTDQFTDVADISTSNIEARRFSALKEARSPTRAWRVRESCLLVIDCRRCCTVDGSTREGLGEISQVTREVTLQPRRTPA